MGKIDDYATGTAGLTDKLLASDGSTGVTKNLLVSDIVDGLTTYLEVDISSAELLALQGTPKTILAAPGANKYYKYIAISEYTFVTTQYAGGPGAVLYLNQGSQDYYFGVTAAITSAFSTATTGTNYGYAKLNTAITCTLTTNPTLGDGTVKIKIWYTIEDFG